jgi:HEAT repeats
MIIVVNCPGCRKRYELDGALAGKKSRCKQCGEIFRIPVPTARVIEPAAAPPVPPSAPPSQPSWTAVPLAEGLVGEPVVGGRSRPAARPPSPPPFRGAETGTTIQPPAARGKPAPPREFNDDLPPPARAGYGPVRRERYSGRGDDDSDVGLTVTGLFLLAAFLVLAGIFIYQGAMDPMVTVRSPIWTLSTGLVTLVAFGIGLWGGIWLLVMAFRTEVTEGLFCLFVPFYAILFAARRWQERRGAFVLGLAPAAWFLMVFLSAAIAGYMRAVNERGADSTSPNEPRVADNAGAPTWNPAPWNPARSNRKADAAAVRRAEQAARENIAALREHARVLSEIRDPVSGQRKLTESFQTAASVQMLEQRSRMIKLSDDEMVALKHAVGSEMRSAILAVRQEYARLFNWASHRTPNMDRILTALDQAADRWSLKPGEEVPPTLVESSDPFGVHDSGPRIGIGPDYVGGMMEQARVQYHNMQVTFGDRVVLLIVSGIPMNGDSDRGVTTRDVVAAIERRAKELAPEITQTARFQLNERLWLVLAPVNDRQSLAAHIDFGAISVKGAEISVQLDGRWALNVPRLPPEPKPGPGAAPPGARAQAPDPEVPLGADLVTRSLIELKSSDKGKRRQALERLRRTVPDGRVDQVVAAAAPLVEDDDEWLAKEAIGVLGAWKSPEAMAALVGRMRDNRHFVRSDAIKALGNYREPRAAEAIVTVIKEDGFAVEDALKSMGEAGEPALIALLRSPDSGVRGQACRILAQIGGQKTLAEMQSLPPDPDLGVRMAAQDAWKRIIARVGPPPRPARGKTGKAAGR